MGTLNKAFRVHVPLQMQRSIIRQMGLVPRQLTRMKNIAYDFFFRYNAINGDAAVAAARLPNATHVTVRAAMNPLHGFMTAQGGVYATSTLFESLLRMAHYALSSKCYQISLTLDPFNRAQPLPLLNLTSAKAADIFNAVFHRVHQSIDAQLNEQPTITIPQCTQMFKVQAKDMATSTVVHYELQFQTSYELCIDYYTLHSNQPSVAVRNRLSKSVMSKHCRRRYEELVDTAIHLQQCSFAPGSHHISTKSIRRPAKQPHWHTDLHHSPFPHIESGNARYPARYYSYASSTYGMEMVDQQSEVAVAAFSVCCNAVLECI